ncbi:MAG: type II toxin-antitoxin system VapC family toxin [Thermomicrobiales bacterium]
MIVIDASVWVSYLVSHDVHHRASVDWIDRGLESDGSFLAPVLLLAEVAGAVTRRTNDPLLGQQARAMFRALPALTLVILDELLGDQTADLAVRLRLRGADATYVAVAVQFGIPLVSWDGEHLSRAAAAVPVFTPSLVSFSR